MEEHKQRSSLSYLFQTLNLRLNKEPGCDAVGKRKIIQEMIIASTR